MQIIKINNGKKDIVIGESNPDKKIFLKKIMGSKHIFKKLDAIGIDSDYFTNVLYPNNYNIVTIDLETGIRYSVTAEKFFNNVQYYHFKDEGIDHRAQAFLPRRFWDIEKL